MQTGIYGSPSSPLSFEFAHNYCAGYREDPTRSSDPVDRINIQGMSEGTSSKNPHFLAVLEERVISFVV